ncbi:MAG: carbohydrate porin [Calothrix sp. CSU_2_0]|nr:carbohydrate porin [Calothrix sp. CSU_2_0]
MFAVSNVDGNDINGNVVFSHRTELNIDSSFTGKDKLRMRLLARNSTRFGRVADTDMANLSFSGDSRNDVEISQFSYQFRPMKKLQVFISTEGGSFTSFANSLNSPISSSAIGHISNFSDQSAIYDLSGGVGAGIEYRFSDRVSLSLGYMAGDKPNNPQQGIAGGEYGAIAQLTLRPIDKLSLGLTYIRAYNSLDTGKGSEFANDPFDGAANTANAYGIQTSYRFNQRTTLSGWVGLIDAESQSSENKGDKAKILTWAATLGLNDIGGEGNLLGLVIGQPPKVIETDVDERKDPNTALHFEAFYRYRINDNMYITPGFYVIINPEHNANNDAIYVGTIRKTFLF